MALLLASAFDNYFTNFYLFIFFLNTLCNYFLIFNIFQIELKINIKKNIKNKFNLWINKI